MNESKNVDAIAELIFSSLDSGHFYQARTGHAGNNQLSDVKHETIKHLSELKRNPKSEELQSKVLADTNIAQAMGWMTEETHNKIITMIGEL